MEQKLEQLAVIPYLKDIGKRNKTELQQSSLLLRDACFSDIAVSLLKLLNQ